MAIRFNLAGSAARIYWQGHQVLAAGIIGDAESTELAGNQPATIILTGPPEGDLLIVVSNYHHVDGGLWSAIRIGPQVVLTNDLDRSAGLDWFLAGAFIVFGFLGVILAFFLKPDRSTLWFGLLTLVLGIRIMFHGSLVIYQLWPDLDFQVFNKVRHWTMYLAPWLFVQLFTILLAKQVPRWFSISTGVIAALGWLVVLALPYRWYGDLLYPYFGIMIVEALIMGGIIISAIRKGNQPALTSLIGVVLFIGSGLYDFLRVSIAAPWLDILPLSTLVLFIFIAASVGQHLTATFRERDRLNRRIHEVNRALQRFFPHEFLSLLGKESLEDVELGQSHSMEMAVLFADIRGFSHLTQDMSPEEIFALVNTFLGAIGPVIRQSGGIVDKYLGDGIMALFPGGGYAAVLAARNMISTLDALNAEHATDGMPEVNIGVGIHCGEMLIGTIGESERMDTTVISSVVNLASRLEALTRDYDARIIISADVAREIPADPDFEYRFLGIELIRGFDHPLPVYELYCADPEAIRTQKHASKAEMEDALALFGRHEYSKANKTLVSLHRRYPDDGAIGTYLERIRDIQERQTLYGALRDQTATKSRKLDVPGKHIP